MEVPALVWGPKGLRDMRCFLVPRTLSGASWRRNASFLGIEIHCGPETRYRPLSTSPKGPDGDTGGRKRLSVHARGDSGGELSVSLVIGGEGDSASGFANHPKDSSIDAEPVSCCQDYFESRGIGPAIEREWHLDGARPSGIDRALGNESSVRRSGSGNAQCLGL